MAAPEAQKVSVCCTACFHVPSSTLPLQETEPIVFFSIWMSFFLEGVNIASVKSGYQPKNNTYFLKLKGKNPA